MEKTYVSVQPLWFLASKACLKEGITYMCYIQLARLLLAGITSLKCTSLNLWSPVYFIYTRFSYAAMLFSISGKCRDQSITHPGVKLFYFFFLCVHTRDTFSNLLCRPCYFTLLFFHPFHQVAACLQSNPEDAALLSQIPLQKELLLPGWGSYLRIIGHRCRWSELESCCFNIHRL